jgi:hypothetical protein
LLETLANLMYLIRYDSHDPAKIDVYVELADKAIERMREIVYESWHGYSPN